MSRTVCKPLACVAALSLTILGLGAAAMPAMAVESTGAGECKPEGLTLTVPLVKDSGYPTDRNKVANYYPKDEALVANADKLPAGTVYRTQLALKYDPGTEGEHPVTVDVFCPAGHYGIAQSVIRVEDVPVKPVQRVAYIGETSDLNPSDFLSPISRLPKGTQVSWLRKPDTSGRQVFNIGLVRLAFPNGSTEVMAVTLEMLKPGTHPEACPPTVTDCDKPDCAQQAKTGGVLVACEPKQPDKPVAPDKPTEPQHPDTPSVPDTPKPDTPDTPKPVTPEKPTEPDKPTQPTQPEKPSEPEKPDTPSTPSEPDKPSVPTTPSEPKQPTEPEKPETPVTPEKPTQPTAPETPTQPDKPSQPAAPVAPSQPDKPDAAKLAAPAPQPEQLAKTGSDIGWIAAIAIASLAMGIGLALTSKRI